MAKTPPSTSDGVVDNTPTPGPIGGKGHATPTRREREAANLKPLVQSDRKAANKAARAKMAETRDRARIGMANGEDRYLGIRDKGPQRRFVRDYVDARFSVGEIMIPLLFAFIIASAIPGAETYAFIAMYGFFLVTIIDCVILGSIVTKKITARSGEGSVQKGTRLYAAMRAVQLRPMRLPKPQVKRGNYPE